LPADTFQVTPLESIQKYLEAVYKDFKNPEELIANETYISCLFLPDSIVASDNGQLELCI
jgi:hypothetical protein